MSFGLMTGLIQNRRKMFITAGYSRLYEIIRCNYYFIIVSSSSCHCVGDKTVEKWLFGALNKFSVTVISAPAGGAVGRIESV